MVKGIGQQRIKKPVLGLYRLILSLCLLYAAQAYPHGSVVDDDDLCVIKIGFYQAHFTIFQPRNSGHEEFCEDLPATGETVFVMDYLHDSMREVAVDFRIVRDRNQIGRFARYEDVLALDLDRDTVFYQPPLKEADAVFTILHEFLEPGGYIGVVSVEHPTSTEVFRAVFPFEIGRFPWTIAIWAALACSAVLLLLWFRFRGGRAQVLVGIAQVTGVLILVWVPEVSAQGLDVSEVMSESGRLRLSYASDNEPMAINTMHSWVVHLQTAEGAPVEDAEITVVGGMPDHDHGLPTAPRVTENLGAGDYLLEGMKFHMNGRWEIVFTITQTTTGKAETATLELDL